MRFRSSKLVDVFGRQRLCYSPNLETLERRLPPGYFLPPTPLAPPERSPPAVPVIQAEHSEGEELPGTAASHGERGLPPKASPQVHFGPSVPAFTLLSEISYAESGAARTEFFAGFDTEPFGDLDLFAAPFGKPLHAEWPLGATSDEARSVAGPGSDPGQPGLLPLSPLPAAPAGTPLHTPVVEPLGWGWGGGSGGPGVTGGRNTLTHSRVACPDGRGQIQSETAVAISGQAVVVAFNDFRGFYCPTLNMGYQVTGWAFSLDGGTTFWEGGALPGHTSLRGDPWLATGPDGTIYLASLWNGIDGLAVLRGRVTVKGISWSLPTVINQEPYFDREAMAVDPVSGHVYITYTRPNQPGGIWLLRSTDGARSFEGPFPVRTGYGAPGSAVAVGTGGEVYVAWWVRGAPGTIGFAVSRDGGQTFSQELTVGQVCDFAVPGSSRYAAFPQIAVDSSGGPAHGSVYVAWNSACARGDGDIMITRSADGGASWSPAAVVNDDPPGAIQFFPTLNVDAAGGVNVSFYDRRQNPGTALTDVYHTRSVNSGATFARNARITEVPSLWEIHPDGAPNFGDYNNSVSVGLSTLVAYADSRHGDPDVYVTLIPGA